MPTVLKCIWGDALSSHNDKKYNQWVILECKHLKDHITLSTPYLSFSSDSPLGECQLKDSQQYIVLIVLLQIAISSTLTLYQFPAMYKNEA